MKETLEQGHKVMSDEEFEKILTVKNIGQVPWPKDTMFVRAEGEEISTVISNVGEIQPGQTAEISVKVKAPTKPGRYVTIFKLSYGDNKSFGQRPWVDFNVIDEA